MLRMLQNVLLCFQRFPAAHGSSTQHGRSSGRACKRPTAMKSTALECGPSLTPAPPILAMFPTMLATLLTKFATLVSTKFPTHMPAAPAVPAVAAAPAKSTSPCITAPVPAGSLPAVIVPAVSSSTPNVDLHVLQGV